MPKKRRTRGKSSKRVIANETRVIPTSSSNGSARPTAAVEELPGFYYDAEKKKYFRIVPGHNNAMSGVVTRETVDSRQSILQHRNALNLTDSKLSNSTITPGSSVSRNIVNLLTSTAIGQSNSYRLRHQVMTSTICNLTYRGCKKVDLPSDMYQYNNLNQLLLSADEREVICLWSAVHEATGSMRDVVQRFSLDKIRKKSPRRSVLDLTMIGYLNHKPYRISSICFTGKTESKCRPVLYTTALDGDPSNVMSFAVVDPVTNGRVNINGVSRIPMWFYRVGKTWTWSSASNNTGSHFVVGAEKKSVVFDVETGLGSDLHTGSDVLALAYAKMSDNVLYAGTRAGVIRCYRSDQCVNTLRHSSSIFSLNVTRDDSYLVAADFKGQIKMWDLRQNKVVMEYVGNVNTMAVSTAVGLDNRDNFLYAVGSDGLCRLWSLKSGELLKSIVPPHPVTKTTLPSVCLSDSFGKASYPGLILGSRNAFHLYSL